MRSLRRALVVVFASSLILSSLGGGRQEAVRKADQKAIEGATDGGVQRRNESMTDADTKVPERGCAKA
jgi:hypothetical protein